jgi:hypothetical protein
LGGSFAFCICYTTQMAEIKTKKTNASAAAFIAKVADKEKQKDAKQLLKIFKEVTGLPAKMWGASMIGFGSYHYKSERSAQEGDWPLTGFSPRKQNLTIYIMPGFKDYGALLKKLGPHKTSVGCLYLKRLSDIDLPTLRALIKRSVADMKKRQSVK